MILLVSHGSQEYCYILFNNLHLLFDRHPSNTEGGAQLRSPLLLQQLAVVVDDAVRLPRQLSLGLWNAICSVSCTILEII